MASVDITGGDARFEFGRVVSQTLGLIGRNFVLFVLLALVFIGVPQFGMLYAQSIAITSGDFGSLGALSIGAVIVNMITSFVLQGALTRAAVDDLSGAGVKFGAAIGDGLRYFFPLLVVAFLVGLGLSIGFVLLILPGIILAVRWAVTAPVVVIEEMGPTASMGRSAELSEGHRWSIFGLMLLYFAFAIVVQMVFGAVIGAVGAGGAVDPTQVMVMDGLGLGIAIASAALAAIVALVSTVGTAALYFELRRVKDGVGVEDLARVFN